jgi:hypothetical protein
MPALGKPVAGRLQQGGRRLSGGGGKLHYGPPWRNNLEFPIAYVDITHTCRIPNMGTILVGFTCVYPDLETVLFPLMGLP